MVKSHGRGMLKSHARLSRSSEAQIRFGAETTKKKKNNGKLDERKYSQTMQHMLVDRHHFKIVRLFPFRLTILELR